MNNESKALNSASVKSIKVEGKTFTQLHVSYQRTPTDEQTEYTWNAYILLQKSVSEEKLLVYLSDVLVCQVLTLAVSNNVTEKTNKQISNDYKGLLLAQYLSNKALICLSRNECLKSVRALLEVSSVVRYQFLGLSHNSFLDKKDNLIVSQLL